MWRAFCMFSLGVPFFLLGLAIRQGWTNKWYLHTQLVPYMPPSTMYALFPLSLAFFLLPILFILPISQELKANLLIWGWGICFSLMLIFPIWKPNFLKPKWLRQLEAEYPPDVIAYFRQEWSKMDRDEWARKISTEEGLEELIRMVTD